MKHYVVYHNTQKRGAIRSAPGRFLAEATKSIKHLIGSRVWLISGEGRTSPKSYYLRLTFTVDEIELVGGKYRAVGSNGLFLDPPIQLDNFSWFPDFPSRQQNFSLGAQAIPDDFVRHFEDLAKT